MENSATPIVVLYLLIMEYIFGKISICGVEVYLVLGCGDVGFSVAGRLKERRARVTVVDKNPRKVERLKKMGYHAIAGDFRSLEVLTEAGIKNAEIVFIMSPDFSTTEATLKTINKLKAELKIDPVVVARVSDEGEGDDAKLLGATDILSPPQIMADFTGNFEKLKAMTNEKKLRAVIQGFRGKMAIILQRAPDPDSIASGMALKLYARAFGVDADIIYDGESGYSQNKALLNLLGMEMISADKIDVTQYFNTTTQNNQFALVDVATRANCPLPKEIMVPAIVIDHHSVPSGEVNALYKDISPVGAAATLLTNYLRYGFVEIDPATAAALVVGILIDTNNFTRGAKPLDYDAFQYLMQIADVEIVKKLQQPSISSDTLDTFIAAIRNRKLTGWYLTANVGEVKERDIIPQVADFLQNLNLEGVTTVLAYGVVGDTIHACARTKDLALHLGETLKKAFNKVGSAGGHPHMAAAKIPLSALGRVSKRNLKREIDRLVRQKFLETVGVAKPSKRRRKRTK